MNLNDSNFADVNDFRLGFAGSHKKSPREDRFAARIGAFEQCRMSDPAGITNILRVAAADLFRTIPIVERDAVDELREGFENRHEHMRPALHQYVRTLQVLQTFAPGCATLVQQ